MADTDEGRELVFPESRFWQAAFSLASYPLTGLIWLHDIIGGLLIKKGNP